MVADVGIAGCRVIRYPAGSDRRRDREVAGWRGGQRAGRRCGTRTGNEWVVMNLVRRPTCVDALEPRAGLPPNDAARSRRAD